MSDETPIDEYPYGARIQFLRQKRGLTQVKLAGACSVSQSTICQIEKGQFTPSLEVLKSISQALDTHLARLFAADDVPVLELKQLRKRYKTWKSLSPSLRKQLLAVKAYIDSLD